MTPQEGSRAHRAIELIGQQGAVRSTSLAEQLGISCSALSALLNPYCDDGTLVACKVEKPGTRPENEYRLGLAGAGHRMAPVPAAHQGGAPVVRRPTIDAPSRLHLDAEAARQRTESKPAPVVPAKSVAAAPPVATAAPEPSAVVPVPAALPAAAPSAERFRVALASDATLILWIPGQAQPVDLPPEHTRALVDYLRKLDALSGAIGAEGDMPGFLMRQAQ